MLSQLKTVMRARLPLLVPFWEKVRYYPLRKKSPERIFTEAYHGNKWENRDTRSGPGSDLRQTEALRRALPLLIQQLNCKSLLDIPCGDFFWMKFVDIGIEYIGGDVVDALIRDNQRHYSRHERRFIRLDLLQDTLPKVDLILCRDCLVHFSYQHIFRALANIKSSGSTYLLTTTFLERKKNYDIYTGRWRPLNLRLPPFSFPAPVKLIDEECPWNDFRDKYLGLWQIDNIP